ncbi:unnamed protein product, partial [Prorocentrum cordatum]
MAIGDSIPDYVAVAVQKNQVKMAGRYNSMDCMRCFMHMLEFCMGCTPTEYTEELHQWFLKRQCRKYGRDAAAELAYFGVVSCDSMTTALGRMRKALNTTSQVSAATMYVLFCETRQAINRYSLHGLWYLIELHDKRKSVELDGIPEFRVLASCLSVVTQKVQHTQQYRGLVKAAKGLGIKCAKSYTKKKLAALVQRGMQKPAGAGARKRSYEELVSAVRARGGSEYVKEIFQKGTGMDVSVTRGVALAAPHAQDAGLAQQLQRGPAEQGDAAPRPSFGQPADSEGGAAAPRTEPPPSIPDSLWRRPSWTPPAAAANHSAAPVASEAAGSEVAQDEGAGGAHAGSPGAVAAASDPPASAAAPLAPKAQDEGGNRVIVKAGGTDIVLHFGASAAPKEPKESAAEP